MHSVRNTNRAALFQITKVSSLLPVTLDTCTVTIFNPLTPKDLKRRRAVRPLKIKILSRNMHEKPTSINYSFSLLIMYGSSYMFRQYIAIFRERF
jgi:hypothetical protein